MVDLMLTRAHEEMWAAVRAELRSQLGKERFSRWIAPIKLLSEEGEEVRLGVANRFVQDWLEKTYLPVIRSTYRAVAVSFSLR